MNLKDAFRYKNFLNNLTGQLRTEMHRTENLLLTTVYHKIHDANPDAADRQEVIEVPTAINIDAALAMYGSVIAEIQKLTEAINTAKAGLEFDLDAFIQVNSKRREMADALKDVLRAKSSETDRNVTGYKFNNEGTQQPYVYVATHKKTERFNRENFKLAMTRSLKESDKLSARIDSCMVNTEVEYTPRWDVNESLEDILPQFESVARVANETK